MLSMKTLLPALVFAALFAAVATQTYVLLFDGKQLVLHGLCFLAAFLTGLATVRFGRSAPVGAGSAPVGAGSAPAGAGSAPASAGSGAAPVVEEQRRPPRARRRGSRSRQSADPAAERETGTVKWFDANKGYGFVVRANGEEIFVHHRAIRPGDGRKLTDGQAVRFVAVERSRGWQAEDVEALQQ